MQTETMEIAREIRQHERCQSCHNYNRGIQHASADIRRISNFLNSDSPPHCRRGQMTRLNKAKAQLIMYQEMLAGCTHDAPPMK